VSSNKDAKEVMYARTSERSVRVRVAPVKWARRNHSRAHERSNAAALALRLALLLPVEQHGLSGAALLREQSLR